MAPIEPRSSPTGLPTGRRRRGAAPRQAPAGRPSACARRAASRSRVTGHTKQRVPCARKGPCASAAASRLRVREGEAAKLLRRRGSESSPAAGSMRATLHPDQTARAPERRRCSPQLPARAPPPRPQPRPSFRLRRALRRRVGARRRNDAHERGERSADESTRPGATQVEVHRGGAESLAMSSPWEAGGASGAALENGAEAAHAHVEGRVGVGSQEGRVACMSGPERILSTRRVRAATHG